MTPLERARSIDAQLELLQERLDATVRGALVVGVSCDGVPRRFLVAGITYGPDGTPRLWDGCDVETAIHFDNVTDLTPAAAVRNATAPMAPGRST